MMNRGSQFKKKNQPSYLLEKLDIMNDIHWEFTSIHFITGTHMPGILCKQYAEQSKAMILTFETTNCPMDPPITKRWGVGLRS